MTLDADRPEPMHEVAVDAFGVRLGVGTPLGEFVPRIERLLPPNAQPCDPGTVQEHFTFTPRGATTVDVRYDVREGEPVHPNHVALRIATAVDVEFGLAMLESYIRGALALGAPHHLFVAGGVVAVNGRAIVLPGFGLTGKTTLVSALVARGAKHYSDEFAVLDDEGLVHPYGAPPASEPLPIGAVVVTRYRPGAQWRPRALSPGESVLSLVPYAVPYQEDPQRCTQFIMRAMEDSPAVLVTDRGEAGEVAPLLLSSVQQVLAAAD